jgi:hypothetical protein
VTFALLVTGASQAYCAWRARATTVGVTLAAIDTAALATLRCADVDEADHAHAAIARLGTCVSDATRGTRATAILVGLVAIVGFVVTSGRLTLQSHTDVAGAVTVILARTLGWAGWAGASAIRTCFAAVGHTVITPRVLAEFGSANAACAFGGIGTRCPRASGAGAATVHSCLIGVLDQALAVASNAKRMLTGVGLAIAIIGTRIAPLAWRADTAAVKSGLVARRLAVCAGIGLSARVPQPRSISWKVGVRAAGGIVRGRIAAAAANLKGSGILVTAAGVKVTTTRDDTLTARGCEQPCETNPKNSARVHSRPPFSGARRT